MRTAARAHRRAEADLAMPVDEGERGVLPGFKGRRNTKKADAFLSTSRSSSTSRWAQPRDVAEAERRGLTRRAERLGLSWALRRQERFQLREQARNVGGEAQIGRAHV